MMEIPSQPRVERSIRHALEFLLREEVCWLPVDSLKYAKRLFREVKTLGSISRKLHIERNEVIQGKDADTFYFNGVYKLIYDEQVVSKERIRWTLMHEIAHVVLGHLEDFEETRLQRGALGFFEYKVLEREADIFTREVLSPFILLKKMNLRHWTHIMDICKLSEKAARIRSEEVKKKSLLRIYCDFEDPILRQFDFYLKNVVPRKYP